MDAKRQIYWYSIISYIPSSIRYERINIGAVMGTYTSNKIRYKLLPENSKKIDGLLWNPIEKKEYKTSKELLEFLLERNSSNAESLFSPERFFNINDWLNAPLPFGIEFSDIHNAETSRPEMIFNHLIEEYVGNKFFSHTTKSKEFKSQVDGIFSGKKLINTKLKPNVIVKPSTNISFDMKMDYAFQNDKINLIQLVNAETIHQLYTRMTTFLYKSSNSFTKKDLGIYLVINKTDYTKDSNLSSMLKDIESDDRVSNMLLADQTNKPLDTLIPTIEDANSIENWTKTPIFKY